MRRILIGGVVAALTACGGSKEQIREEPKIGGSERIGAVASFSPGDIAAYEIKDHKGRVFGKAHSRLAQSEQYLEVVTRVEIDYGILVGKPGTQVNQTEHASIFRPEDLSPVKYKRFTSTDGRFELDFERDGVSMIKGLEAKRVRGERVLLPLLPDHDLMMLAIVVEWQRLEAGSSGVMDVFVPARVDTEPRDLQVFADPSGNRVVQLGDAKATLDARGQVTKLEDSDRGWLWQRKVPPFDPPRVEFEPPLEYRRPTQAAWEDTKVEIQVRAGVISGVLSMPIYRSGWAKKLAPAVVLLSDIGPQDRHGFSGSMDYGTWEIADYLADHAIAVLRVDDRGTGASVSSLPKADEGLNAAVEDAKALVAFLELQPGINPEKIFLLGHGVGGVVAAAAAKEVKARGVALVASPFRTLPHILVRRESVLFGADPAEAKQRMDMQIAALKGNAAAKAKLSKAKLAAAMDQKALLLEHESLDMAKALMSIPGPVAVFQGLKDFEVDWKKDGQRVVDTLKKRPKKPPVKFFAYPRVDHLMKEESRESSLLRYTDRTRRVQRDFLEDLGAWITKHAKP